jgi:tetratricopeptide (TPR) repeat protein
VCFKLVVSYRIEGGITAYYSHFAALIWGCDNSDCSLIMLRFWLPFLLLLPECVQSQSLNHQGVIQDSLVAQSDPNEYYALYLPEKSNRRKKAILFFEPVGRAYLPLNLYKDLADKYGYTLICPYGSKNGDIQPTLRAASAMLGELELMGYKRNQVYTSGFSGGARAASAIQKLHGVAGVIAVAGAWPPSEEHMPSRDDAMSYVAIVGDKDMNMVEHGQYQDYLTSLSIPNAIVYYAAGHQWPPPSVYKQALEWIDRSLGGYDQMTSYADSLLEVNEYLGYRQWQQWAQYPTNSFPVGQFEERLEALDADPSIAKLVTDHTLAQKKQVELRRGYDQALEQLRIDLFKGVTSEYGIPWWKTEVRKLRRWSSSQDEASALMADRVMDGLTGGIYIMIREATEYNRFEMAETLNQIMLMMNPESVLYRFNEAVYLALQGQYKQARKSLATAEELDQILLNRLRANPLYMSLKSQDQYSFLFENVH